ncbi:MAG: DNA-formamidopyrimidine glycosylase family protein [Polyangiaceae bacterium]
MPEGDTIFRTARTLRLALEGRTVTRAELPRLVRPASPLVGSRVVAVESRGKNLLVHFDVGMVLHTHMKMTGSWHVYRPDERWRKRESEMRARIDTSDHVAVCFSAPVVRLMDDREASRDPFLAGLGPDLAAESFDADLALARLRTLPDRTIAEAIVDQGAMAGVGNIFKSEVLFVARVDPFAKVGDLDDGTLARVVATSRKLLLANLGSNPERRTTGGSGQRSPVWLYERDGKPCLVCGTVVTMVHHGSPPRNTFLCTTCQPPHGPRREGAPGPS